MPAPDDSGKLATLFDQLCVRWARELDLMVIELGRVFPTLVVLPRDATADEVAIRVEGLRGNLTERADAIVAELRPSVAEHDPAGLVFFSDMRLPDNTDGIGLYVSLGGEPFRRALGYRIERDTTGVA
ncbi:MAG TPA: hypothetical protein VNA28_12840, partial [Solirubrobacteraceae bacterium]|nr:hypothetical protein [Solirubrobacteraceae bacterium]